LLVWFPPNEGKQWQYIIGVDAAGGGSDGDYACAGDRADDGVAVCGNARTLSSVGIGAAVVALDVGMGARWWLWSGIIMGMACLAHLKDLGYEHLYQQGGQDGWLTSVVTRPAMIELLAAALIEEPELFYSPRLLGELKTLCGMPMGMPRRLTERMTIA